MKVLFFSAWYPHRYDAMSGLFVRKHAEAVAAQGVDVAVLYLMADPNIRKREWVEQTTNGVHEFYIYYPFHFCSGIMMRISKMIHYTLGFLWGWKKLLQRWGRPDLTQANVLTRSAVLSNYLYRRYHIPYIIIEHWTRYLPENLSFTNPLHKKITSWVAKDAKAILPVSSVQAKCMQDLGIHNPHYGIIENVVDDFFYEPIEKHTNQQFTFVHVSCFWERAKNTCGILRATEALYRQRQDFRVIMIGTGVDIEQNVALAKDLQLSENIVHFTGEQPPLEVANWMKNADSFLLFSNYENAPVVLSEALAVGLPIVTSNVGFVPEVITPDVGRIVNVGDEAQLAQTMSWMIDNSYTFNRDTIRQHGHAYSYETVGKRLVAIYQAALS